MLTNSNKHWAILLAVMLGNVFIGVNSTMLALALSTIAKDFHESLPQVSWVMTIYLMVMAGTLPLSGKLGDRFGSKTIFLSGMFLFLFSSIGASFSTHLNELILFRAIQALGGAFALPNASGILRYVTPKEHMGKVFGVLSSSAGIGSALGPFLGSMLIKPFGWKSVFFVGEPFTVISILLVFFLAPKFKKNVVGAERIFDFSLFKNVAFVSSNLSIFANNLFTYGIILALPIVFEKKLNLPIEIAGYILTSFFIAYTIFSIVGGFLSDRFGPRISLLSSYVLACFTTILFVFLNTRTAIDFIYGISVLTGIAIGVGFSSSQVANVQSVPKEKTASASGIYQTFRYLGAVTASVVVSWTNGNVLFFLFLIFICFIGIIVSFGVPSKENFKVTSSKTAV